jgi:uncharacterized metal-binding protein YceD (DUF177 family)
MKIHLKQIPAEGLHLEGEEDCPIPELAAEGIRCVGPLRYDLDVGISAGALWANGTLKQPIEVSCVSCLERFVHEIKVPAFALHTELHGPETVDLTPFIREDILLNLPAYPHCDHEGGKVCKAPEEIKKADENAVLEERPPDWSALDKLKLKR